MPATDENGSDWQAVIGRSLAFICLHVRNMKNESYTAQAKFLKGLGLSTSDAAGVLGTTPASLYELFRQERKKRRDKRVAKRKKRP